MNVETATAAHAEELAVLFEHENWPTWADPERTRRALTGPGVSAVVALDGGEIVGAAQMVSDGSIASYMSMLLVRESHRREGLGRQLVGELFERSGMARIDLLAGREGTEFYRRLRHREFNGFRLYPETGA